MSTSSHHQINKMAAFRGPKPEINSKEHTHKNHLYILRIYIVYIGVALTSKNEEMREKK